LLVNVSKQIELNTGRKKITGMAAADIAYSGGRSHHFKWHHGLSTACTTKISGRGKCRRLQRNYC